MAGIKEKFHKIIDKIKFEYDVVFGPKAKNKTYLSCNRFDSEEEAIKQFQRSIEKLLDVEKWSDLPGATSKFELYGPDGLKRKGKPSIGDHIRILIKGPTPENWVEVIDLKKKEDVVSFIVKPDYDPREANEEDVEHFFTKEATSEFKVKREGNKILGFEIGKNEDVNNKGKEAGNRSALNTFIAETGWLIYQKIQWQKLTDYLVHKIEIENK